jgi:hypothetical protein
MRIPLFPVMAAVGLATLVACGGSDNGPPAASMSGGGTSSGGSGSGSSAPNSAGPPTDFVAFVNQQILVQTQPAFGTAPAATSSLTTDLALGTANAFIVESFGAGSALPPGTYQASVACTAAGMTACNPTLSVDLNSTLN